MSLGRGTILLGAGTIAVVATVAASIAVLGSPAQQRRQRLDLVREQNLGSIEQLIGTYSRVHKALPADLRTLAAEPGRSWTDQLRAQVIACRVAARLHPRCALIAAARPAASAPRAGSSQGRCGSPAVLAASRRGTLRCRQSVWPQGMWPGREG